MDLPLGFEEMGSSNKVCRLRKPLYSLEQSARAWFDRFRKAIKSHDFTQAQADHTLLFKYS